MNFSQQIKSERARLGMKQAQVAFLLDVSISAIQKWEAGIKTPLVTTQEGVLARLKKHKVNTQ